MPSALGNTYLVSIGCPESPRMGSWEGNPESGMRHVGDQGRPWVGRVQPPPSIQPALPSRPGPHAAGPGESTGPLGTQHKMFLHL